VTFITLSIGWAFLFESLIPKAFSAGLIMGFLIFLFLVFWSLYLIGWLNTILADVIWNAGTRDDWKSLLCHGFFLFIIIISVQILALLIYLSMPSLVTAIVLFIIYCFINGLLCKAIAERYEIMGAHSLSHSFFRHIRNESRKFIALVIIIVVSVGFLGYVCWSLVVSFSNVAAFTDKLQKDGFTITPYSDTSLAFGGVNMAFPVSVTIVCQNQTQFIYEARIINSTPMGPFVYLMNGAHFYVVGYGSFSYEWAGYEYTPPLPSPFDSMIIWWLSQ
jgi:hypothetical protein